MPEKLMKLPEVTEMTALSRSEIYRRIQAGTFPQQTRISHRVSRWKAREVEDWVLRATGGKPAPAVKSVELLDGLL